MAEEPPTNDEQVQLPAETPQPDAALPSDAEDVAQTLPEVERPAAGAADSVEQTVAENEAAADAFSEASAGDSELSEDATTPGPTEGAEAEAAAPPEQATLVDGSAAAVPADDVEAEMAALLAQAETEQEIPSGTNCVSNAEAPPEGADAPNPAADARPFAVPDFNESDGDGELGQIDLLDDVELEVKIELGRTEMYIEDVIQLGVGAVIELDKLAGDPVDIYVNERLVARGEVLVLNDNFCVRVNDILSPIPELEHAS